MEVHIKPSALTNQLKAHDKQIIKSDGVLPLGSRILFFVSPKGGGKTSLYLSLLTAKESPYYKYYDNIMMVNPSGMHDKKIKDFYEELEEDGKFYDQLSEATAIDIKTKLQAISDAWRKKRPVQNLLIIDDSSGDFPSGRKKSAITQLFTNSRHLGTSIWLISHKYNSVPTIWRNQADGLFLFKTNSKLEVETLKKDLNVSEDFLELALKDATKEPYSFLFVNMSSGQPRLFRKFDEYQVVEEDD
jgi:hypothetical protein